MNHWYCFLVDGQKMRGTHDMELLIHNEMTQVFGEDLLDIRIIGDRMTDEDFSMQSENYFFVKCRNYHDHLASVKESSLISLVLPKTDQPSPVPEEEIGYFEHTIKRKTLTKKLMKGDIVQVKEGYLEKLYGIVIGFGSEDSYQTMFRFCTRVIVENLRRSNLALIGSMFAHKKFPVLSIECAENDNMSSDVLEILGNLNSGRKNRTRVGGPRSENKVSGSSHRKHS